eukprot:10818374-Alexandrium_andersonii.AAC.1
MLSGGSPKALRRLSGRSLEALWGSPEALERLSRDSPDDLRRLSEVSPEALRGSPEALRMLSGGSPSPPEPPGALQD